MRNAREVIESAIKYSNLSHAECVRRLAVARPEEHWTRQKFSDKLTRGSMRVDEFFLLLDLIGVDFQMIQLDTGRNVERYVKGYGERARAMEQGIIYDTAVSHALSNSFWEDGEHEYTNGQAQELYVNKEGKYFIVTYSKIGKNSIHSVSDSEAREFMEKHGTDIDKTPNKSMI